MNYAIGYLAILTFCFHNCEFYPHNCQI